MNRDVPEVAAPRPVVTIPGGQATVRECWAREERVSQRARPNPAAGHGGGGRFASAPTSTAAPAGVTGNASTKAAPKASAPIAPMDEASAVSGVGAYAPPPPPSAPSAAPVAEGFAPQEDAVADRSDNDARGEAPAREAKQDAAKAVTVDGKRERSVSDLEAAPPSRRLEPSLDWGATVYLSNDDSMSLASAQRLLWAIQNKGAVKTSEVRPHEFLNYFSFDTERPQGSATFGVGGSAEQTSPDTLTMAFAVKGATPVREPMDLTLVLDRSGSMAAEGRMDYLKRGLLQMVDQLERGDRVDLVLFDDDLCVPLEDFVVGRDPADLLTTAIGDLRPRGATDLDLGLREGYRIATSRPVDSSRNQRMMLVSDALLNTGDVNPATVSEIGKQLDARDIRLTAIGVGRDFNDKVLNMLSEKGKGAYVYLGSEAVVDRVFGVGFPSLVQTIAHDVRFSVDLPPSLAMTKFYGEESSTVKEDVQPIHYYAGTSQLFLQDVRIRDNRPARQDRVTFHIEWSDADTGAARTQDLQFTVGQLLDADPRNVRKARALMAWTDMILARSLGGSPCDAPFSVWRERVSLLGEDAEIGWLDGLTSPLCGTGPVPVEPRPAGVAFKVKLDADLPIAEVALQCGGDTQRARLSGSDNVARFNTTRPGACTLTLAGAVPMVARVEVPSVGGEAQCVVRGGRVSCS